MMNRLKSAICSLQVCLFVLPFLILSAQAEPLSVSEVEKEHERITDLRIVHRGALQELHDARALAVYLRGWGSPDRVAEVETRAREGEALYGLIRGVDYGAAGLRAQIDVARQREETHPPQREALEMLQRGRRSVASEVNEFYKRSRVLKDELTTAVHEAASEHIEWDVVNDAIPWDNALKERGRMEGLRVGWRLGKKFFNLPKERQNYLLAMGQRMGMSFADVEWNDVTNWAQIERKPGEYDFSALDDVVERCTRHGMKVAPVLRALTGKPPEWHRQKYGHQCQFTVQKEENGDDSTAEQKGINLFHEPTRENYQRFLAAYASHLREQWPRKVPAIFAPGGQKELSALVDVSESMDTFWREWDKAHGGNGKDAWRPPEWIDRQENERAYVRAQMCREDWLVRYVGIVRRTLKKHHNDLLVQSATSSDDFHRLFAARTGRSRNLIELVEATENPVTHTDSPAVSGLLRNLSDGQWLWSAGIHSGCGLINAAAVSQAATHGSVRIGMRGPRMSIRHDFPRNWFRYSDWQIGGFGIGSFYLAPMVNQQLSPLILNTRPADAEVAVLWSQTTYRRDTNSRWFKSVIAWGHLLTRAFFRFDYVAERQLQKKLKNYKVLVLPSTHSLPSDVNRTIREWVEQGGILMGFGAPGLYDSYGESSGQLPLSDVFGADFRRWRVPAPITPDKLQTTHPEGSYVSVPPHQYKFETTTYAVIEPTGGEARAWYASSEDETAIVENEFGEGKALLSGYPVGFEYWQAAPYEMGVGMTQERHQDYNVEAKRYEHWVARELEKLGITRKALPASGRMLRNQRADDADWFHVFRQGPTYEEHMFETDRPVRSVAAMPRERDGTDNRYVTLNETRINYKWERGYFISTLAGGYVQVAVEAEPDREDAPVVYDVRLRVPVRAQIHEGRMKMELVDKGYSYRDANPAHLEGRYVVFKIWIPAALPVGFALAPEGNVRLFGEANLDGELPETVLERTEGYVEGEKLEDVEVYSPSDIASFLEDRSGDRVMLGYGHRNYRKSAVRLADWLKDEYDMSVELTAAGPRATTNWTYMSGFGWTRHGDEPVEADIVIGNVQENALMWRYASVKNDVYWLPLEPNSDFPGPGRALITLSLPVKTRANGQPGGKPAKRQLVIGVTNASDALRGVKELIDALQD